MFGKHLVEEIDLHRAIWSTESIQRMDNLFRKNDRYLLLYFLKSNKTFDIMGDPNRFINDGQIIFISSKNCTYDVTLYADYPKTLFRVSNKKRGGIYKIYSVNENIKNKK